MRRIEQRVSSFEFRATTRAPISRLAPRNSRRGITLIEILISMFVLLFGLMGVAAIFPVASHYIVEGEKRDRGSGLAQIAFEELKSRKILRPMTWLYAPGLPSAPGLPTTVSGNAEFMNPVSKLANITAAAGPGHAFVIDPLGAAAGLTAGGSDLDIFSLYSITPQPWFSSPPPLLSITGNRFPVRRLTLNVNPGAGLPVPITAQTAETEFRLRDDLAVQQPEAGDRPSIQTWSKSDPNATPADPSDDQLLSRQYTGDYSWMATVVPTRQRALEGLQPAANIKDEFYEVTTVVFYKRDIVPSASAPGSPGSERLIGAEFMNSGELALYDIPTNNAAAVDLAVDGIKPTNWIAVMGVNQSTGMFLMKWYKIMALDDETTLQNLPGGGTNRNVRYVMVQGPEWPSGSYTNLRVAILPGAIDAYTRVMQIEQE